MFGDATNSNPPAAFWEDLILSKEDDEALSSTNNFYEYFRGLYFKAEPMTPMQGNLMQLDFSSSNANVTIYYTYEQTVTEDEETSTIISQGEYEMNFFGNRVSLFENNFNASVLQTINDKLQSNFFGNEKIKKELEKQYNLLDKNKTTPFVAAEILLKI